MKVLLHTCCAPCLIYPLERLRSLGHSAEGFFYNPNIHPVDEYNKRQDALKEMAEILDFKINYPAYEPSEYFQVIDNKQAIPGRCSICWTLRLKAAARIAKEKGFDSFSTTLLVSPYQAHELLKKIGSAVSLAEGINFYYDDFRVGFKQAHISAREKGIYCQKYCGCIYSQQERRGRSPLL